MPGDLLELLEVVVAQVVAVGGDLVLELLVGEEVDVDGVLELEVALLLDEVDVLLHPRVPRRGVRRAVRAVVAAEPRTTAPTAAATSDQREHEERPARRAAAVGPGSGDGRAAPPERRAPCTSVTTRAVGTGRLGPRPGIPARALAGCVRAGLRPSGAASARAAGRAPSGWR